MMKEDEGRRMNEAEGAVGPFCLSGFILLPSSFTANEPH
jgi:hypothetical protein